MCYLTFLFNENKCVDLNLDIWIYRERVAIDMYCVEVEEIVNNLFNVLDILILKTMQEKMWY